MEVGESAGPTSRAFGTGLTRFVIELFKFFFFRSASGCLEHDVKLLACFSPSNLTVKSLKIVGDVLAGLAEQGIVRPGEETFFLPALAVSSPRTGKFVTVRSANVLSYDRVVAPGAWGAIQVLGAMQRSTIWPRSGCTFWPRSGA